MSASQETTAEATAVERVKSALTNTMQHIQSNPQAARLVFRSQTALESGVRCTAQVRDFAPLTIDEPPELGGEDSGMNPVELMLVALGTCQEIMYAAYASVMGIQLNSVKVDVKGYLDLHGLLAMDEAIPAGYDKIRYETYIDSPADPDSIRKLAETVESHCPVLDTICRPITVSGNVTLNGDKL